MRRILYVALIVLAVMCVGAAVLAGVRQPAVFTEELVDLGSENLLLTTVGVLLAMLVAAMLGDRSVRKMVVALIRAVVGPGHSTSTLLRIAVVLVLFVVGVAVVISAAGKALVSDVGATETPLAVDIAGQRNAADAFDQFNKIVWGQDPEWRQPFQSLDHARYEELLSRVVGDPLVHEELEAVLAHPAVITPTTVITAPRLLIDDVRVARKYSVDVASDAQVQGEWSVGDLTILQVALPHRTIHNGGEINLSAGSAYVVVRRVSCDTCGGQAWHHFVVAALLIV